VCFEEGVNNTGANSEDYSSTFDNVQDFPILQRAASKAKSKRAELCNLRTVTNSLVQLPS